MAHNINSMMYVGEKPWHGLGVELYQPATAEEAIISAGLNWEIALQSIRTDFRQIPEFMATARADNRDVLGIVSPKYRIIQNKDAFSFFDAVVGEGQAIYHTAGALGRGERIWLLAKLPSELYVTNEDIVEKYLCLTNCHTGKASLLMYFTPIRVVCQNTLSVSMMDASSGIAIRHSGDVKLKIKEAQRVLGIAMKFYDEFGARAEQFRKFNMNVEDAEKFFKFVILGEELEETDSTREENKINTLLSLFEDGKGAKLEGVRHTGWAAYNAVTEYVDHYGTIRKLDKDPTNRLKNIWFGSGARIKSLAFNRMSEMVGIT
jgi:phage/plasmid-like protein (TIGR03299 family)